MLFSESNGHKHAQGRKHKRLFPQQAELRSFKKSHLIGYKWQHSAESPGGTSPACSAARFHGWPWGQGSGTRTGQLPDPATEQCGELPALRKVNSG